MSRWPTEKLVGVALLALLCMPGAASAASTMAIQPNGKIVLAGLAEPQFGAVARLNPNGSIDRGFAEGGIAIDRRFNPYSALALQPDGKIVAGAWEGDVKRGFRHPLLARLLPDGALDPSFGRSGAIGPELIGTGLAPATILNGADGGLIVGGTAFWIPTTWQSQATVVSFGPDGAFGGLLGEVPGETKPRSTWNTLSALLARSDGSLVMAGNTHWPADDTTLLARFAPGSAAFDPSFDAGQGLVKQTLAWFDSTRGEGANAIVEDAGELLVAGSAGGRPMVARFSGDGTLDTSFGEGGVVGRNLPGPRYGEATAAAVQPDGGIVVVATVADDLEDSTDHLCRHCREAVVERFSPDGAFDPSFGAGRGLVRFGAGPGPERFARGEDIAVLPGGKILASAMSVAGRRRMVVSRLNPDGTFDASFGEGGVARVLPCPGTLRQRRRTGCLPSLRAGLSVNGLAGRSPSLRLHLRPSLSWAGINEVFLRFPPAFESRMDSSLTYTVIADGYRETAHMEEGEAFRHGLLIFTSGAKDVEIVVPVGCLRRVAPTKPGRKLTFKVSVEFQHAGRQTIALRRSP